MSRTLKMGRRVYRSRAQNLENGAQRREREALAHKLALKAEAEAALLPLTRDEDLEQLEADMYEILGLPQGVQTIVCTREYTQVVQLPPGRVNVHVYEL